MVARRLLLGAALAAAGVTAGERVTVRPVATREALVNPGMGFCHYAYAGRLWAYGSRVANDDTLDWFPGCSTVYMRVLWSEIEPEEGVFRWDIFDRLSQPWIAAGKKIAMRVICCNQTENACPDFVREAGAKGHWFEYDSKYTNGKRFQPRWEPDYADPVFLKKFESFLKAFAVRYDGDPSVAFVDVGSFGLFGEGHSPFLRKLREQNPAEFERQATIHLELWRRNLPRTQLIVSDDIGGSRDKSPDAPLMKKARDMGIGFRDDSIFCAPPPNPWFHAHWGRLFAPQSPVVIETGRYIALGTGMPGFRKDCWQADRMLECVVAHQASYFSIHDFPDEHLKLFRKEIDAVNLRLGYRMELRSVTFPNVIVTDASVTIDSTWVNVGVAPCHAGATLAWSLLDGQGRVRWSVTDDRFDFKTLEPTLEDGEKPQTVSTVCRFGHTVRNPDPDNCLTWARATGRDPGVWNVMLPPGSYTLAVSAGTRQGTPVLALPLPNGLPDRRYPIGTIRLDAGDKGGRQ